MRGVGALAIGVALAATVLPWSNAAVALEQGGASQVTRMANCAALAEKLAVPKFTVQPRGTSSPATTAAPAVTPAPATPVEATPSFTDGDGAKASGTNVQVAGVDEPDLVETDGRLVYSAVRGDLRIVDITTRSQVSVTKFPWADVASRVGPSADFGAQLMLVDKTMVVTVPYLPLLDDLTVSTGAMPAPAPNTTATLVIPGRISPFAQPVVGVAVYDVSNPAAPSLRSQFTLDGALFVARASQGRVLLVTSNTLNGAGRFVSPKDFTSQASVDEANTANAAVLADAGSLLPSATVDGTRRHIDCTSVLMPLGTEGLLTMSALYRLDLRDQQLAPTPIAASFVAWPEAGNLGYTTADAFTLPTRIPESYVVTGPYGRKPSFGTTLLRFDWRTTGRLSATGFVPGRLLDQFAIDEYQGTLRLATTINWQEGGDTSARPQESAVFVLKQKGDTLEEIGRIEGLGQGELIRSARFIGDYGYVVTFRQTDPLYTIDLRKPTAPKLAGELKVLGYSDYLHPVGNHLLLGIGQEADPSNGRPLGSKAALFDVANPAQPRLVGVAMVEEKVRLPWDFQNAVSESERDYHAFLWWATAAKSGKAVLPVNSWGLDANNKIYQASEVAVMKVDGKVLHRQASIRHPIGIDETGFSSPIRRSLVLGKDLVTVSRSGVKINDFVTIKPLAWIPTT